MFERRRPAMPRSRHINANVSVARDGSPLVGAYRVWSRQIRVPFCPQTGGRAFTSLFCGRRICHLRQRESHNTLLPLLAAPRCSDVTAQRGTGWALRATE